MNKWEEDMIEQLRKKSEDIQIPDSLRPDHSDIKTSHSCCLSLALVFDTTSPSAGDCATGISSIGRPSEPRLASPRHGTLTPGRISVGRPHCLIPISVGAVTGRKYHCP